MSTFGHCPRPVTGASSRATAPRKSGRVGVATAEVPHLPVPGETGDLVTADISALDAKLKGFERRGRGRDGGLRGASPASPLPVAEHSGKHVVNGGTPMVRGRMCRSPPQCRQHATVTARRYSWKGSMVAEVCLGTFGKRQLVSSPEPSASCATVVGTDGGARVRLGGFPVGVIAAQTRLISLVQYVETWPWRPLSPLTGACMGHAEFEGLLRYPGIFINNQNGMDGLCLIHTCRALHVALEASPFAPEDALATVAQHMQETIAGFGFQMRSPKSRRGSGKRMSRQSSSQRFWRLCASCALEPNSRNCVSCSNSWTTASL